MRVAVRAADAERLGMLVRLLHAAGHDVSASLAESDVVLIDQPDGDSSAAVAGLPVVLLTDNETAAADPETAGILPRSARGAQIDAALRAAAAGLLVRAKELPHGFAADEDPAPPSLLTPREIEILAAVGTGMSNKQVARALGISAHTVKFHLEAVFAKLGASNRADAVARGLRRHLIEV
jgi:DNA-binding NarL/FixJ family response regulator